MALSLVLLPSGVPRAPGPQRVVAPRATTPVARRPGSDRLRWASSASAQALRPDFRLGFGWLWLDFLDFGFWLDSA